MSNELIERVARAAFESQEWDFAPGDDFSYQSAGIREVFFKVARATIEAMREPTDAMCDAAEWHQQDDVNRYQRAINEALK